MNLFQSQEWEEFKLATGYQKSYRVDGILILQKNLPMGRSMLYSPMVHKDQRLKIKDQNFISKVKDIGKDEKAVFYRLEIDDSLDEASSYQLEANGFIKSFEEMQPEHTLLLDLTLSEEDILKQMKQKGRYNIKVATKKGATVSKDDNTDNFYSLYSGMAKRHKITFRSQSYFKKLFDILSKKDYCEVLTAYAANPKTQDTNPKQASNTNSQITKNCTPIASVIISLYGERAIYLFGGSSDEHRNLMAPYLLQWEAIKSAKDRGCKTYDFFGIAPEGAKNHPWRGVTNFKKKFGGEEIHILGSWDLVLKPTEYRLFRIAEKIRR